MAQFDPKGTRAIMASERQIEANRRNAQHSTGPKTPEGKAASRLNALRHGLTAKHAVIQTEDEAEFLEIQQSFEDHYQPVGPTQTLLVQQIVMAAWRLGRLRGMETGLFNCLLAEEKSNMEWCKVSTRHNKNAHVLIRDARDVGAFTTLARYETRVERSFYRALRELERLQALPRNADVPPDQTNPISPSPIIQSPDHSITKSPDPPSPITKSPDHEIAKSPNPPPHLPPKPPPSVPNTGRSGPECFILRPPRVSST